MKSKNETKKMKVVRSLKNCNFPRVFFIVFRCFFVFRCFVAETSRNEKAKKQNEKTRGKLQFLSEQKSSFFSFFSFRFCFSYIFRFCFHFFFEFFAFHLFFSFFHSLLVVFFVSFLLFIYFSFFFHVFFVLASLRHKSTIVRSISQKLKQNRRKCVIHQQRGFRTSSLGRFPSGEAIAIELQHSFVFHDRFG